MTKCVSSGYVMMPVDRAMVYKDIIFFCLKDFTLSHALCVTLLCGRRLITASAASVSEIFISAQSSLAVFN